MRFQAFDDWRATRAEIDLPKEAREHLEMIGDNPAEDINRTYGYAGGCWILEHGNAGPLPAFVVVTGRGGMDAESIHSAEAFLWLQHAAEEIGAAGSLPETDQDRARFAGHVFNLLLREEVGPEIYARLCEVDPATHGPHDECDANILAAEAFQAVWGRAPDVSSEEDARLFGMLQEYAEDARDTRGPEVFGRG